MNLDSWWCGRKLLTTSATEAVLCRREASQRCGFPLLHCFFWLSSVWKSAEKPSVFWLLSISSWLSRSSDWKQGQEVWLWISKQRILHFSLVLLQRMIVSSIQTEVYSHNWTDSRTVPRLFPFFPCDIGQSCHFILVSWIVLLDDSVIFLSLNMLSVFHSEEVLCLLVLKELTIQFHSIPLTVIGHHRSPKFPHNVNPCPWACCESSFLHLKNLQGLFPKPSTPEWKCFWIKPH